jgi:hypothetical protein
MIRDERRQQRRGGTRAQKFHCRGFCDDCVDARLPLSVHAAPPDFCHDYVTSAMNQIRAALANPGCVTGVRGPRWVQDERIHFQWCLTQSVPMVESERGARTAYLRACRG